MTDGPRRYLISGELRDQLIKGGRALLALQPFEGAATDRAHQQLQVALDALSTWAPRLPESLRLPGEGEPVAPLLKALLEKFSDGEHALVIGQNTIIEELRRQITEKTEEHSAMREALAQAGLLADELKCLTGGL